jgi:hypothetical protein
MNQRLGTTRITWAAGSAALVGPACAVLPYTDYLPPSLLPDLAGVRVLEAIGAIGIGIGVFAFRKGSKVAGTTYVDDMHDDDVLRRTRLFLDNLTSYNRLAFAAGSFRLLLQRE